MLGLGVFFMVMAISAVAAHAGHGFKSGHKFGPGEGKSDECGKMFFMKAHFIEENQARLGLAADKIEAIKNLKLETQKMMVKQDAEIKVADLDIKSKLHDFPIDVEAVNKLVDQKYELKKAEEKNLVEALAKLKSSLSKDQYDKLKELKKSGAEEMREMPQPEERNEASQ